MVWKCQNEISPIFYYGISEKTNEKDLKIPNIQPPDWKNPYWMSLYDDIICIQVRGEAGTSTALTLDFDDASLAR